MVLFGISGVDLSGQFGVKVDCIFKAMSKLFQYQWKFYKSKRITKLCRYSSLKYLFQWRFYDSAGHVFLLMMLMSAYVHLSQDSL